MGVDEDVLSLRNHGAMGVGSIEVIGIGCRATYVMVVFQQENKTIGVIGQYKNT